MAKSTVDLTRFILDMSSNCDNVSVQIWGDGSYRIIDSDGNTIHDSDNSEDVDNIHMLPYGNAYNIIDSCLACREGKESDNQPLEPL